MSKRIQVLGRINEMALPTVRELIGLTAWQRIIELDPEPTFVEMTIAHEGTSRGEVVGWGARLKEWGKRVIQAVVQAFAPVGRHPVRIYDGIDHWHGNQAQRVPVGEVIHSFGSVVSAPETGADVATSQGLGGLQAARVIGWIYPRYKVIAGERDVCSMELDGLLVDINGHTVVEEVYEAVSVVLGHSSKQTPGFIGARVQAITEFGPVEGTGPTETASATTGMGASAPLAAAEAAPASAPLFTGAQLVAAIRAAGLKPADVWPELATVPASLPTPMPTPPEQPQPDAIDPLTAGNPFLPGGE